MALNRLIPQGIFRLPSRVIIRQFSASRSVQNSANEPGTPAPAESQPAVADAEPVEITPSHRRHVTPEATLDSNTKPNQRKYVKNANNRKPQSAEEDPTDFFDAAPSSQSPPPAASRIAKAGDAPISMDLLSSEEFTVITELKEKSKRKSGPRSGSRDGSDTRRQGQGQGQRQGQGQGQRGGKRDVAATGSRGGPGKGPGQGKREGGKRFDRERRDDGKMSAPASSAPLEKPMSTFDTSFKGLFGAASLVAPPRRGARDVGSSFWAKDLDASKARKADLMRLAGSYDLRLPTTPHPSTLQPNATATERAKALARWSISANPTTPMRARDPGLSVVDRLLR